MTQNPTNAEIRVGWVSVGGGRGTSEILWSCLIVFLVCSWKCVHLNVPNFDESRAGWHRWGHVFFWPERPLWRKWFRKIKWMFVIMIAPEFGVTVATRQYMEAKEMCSLMGEGWTMTHAFYANMGGFAFRSRNSLQNPQASISRSDRARGPWKASQSQHLDRIDEDQLYNIVYSDYPKFEPTSVTMADLGITIPVLMERTQDVPNDLLIFSKATLRKSRQIYFP